MISVIIPVFNGEGTLGQCLESLCNQTADSNFYEIIVVDDGSTDRTCQIVQQYPQVKLVSQDNRGPAAARNRGVKEAAGDIVLFTDADCQPTSDWIEKMTAPLAQDSDIAGVKGAYRTKQNELVARFVQLEYESKYHIMNKHRYIDFVDTYSAGFRKDVFLESTGYDETFPVACAEDVELSYRLANKGHRLVFAPDAIVYHLHPNTFTGYLKKKFKFARWRVSAVRTNPNKILKDSHTPQLMKTQAMLAPVVLIAAIWGLLSAKYLPFIVTAAIYFALTIPFCLRAVRKDFVVGLLSPLTLFARSISQFLGVAAGSLSSIGASLGVNKQKCSGGRNYRRLWRNVVLVIIVAGLLWSLILWSATEASPYRYSFARTVIGALAGNSSGYRPMSPPHHDGMRLLRFRFSLSDVEYFNMVDKSARITANAKTDWRRVELEVDGKWRRIRAYKPNLRAIGKGFRKDGLLTIKVGKSDLLDSLRQFDIYRTDDISCRELFHVYDLAKRLSLYCPRTELVGVTINRVDRGIHILRQAYDYVFMEEKAPGGMILKASAVKNGRLGDWQYLCRQGDNPSADAHVKKFFTLLEAKDPNLLMKYFDLDYIARFEALRKLLKANGSFILAGNVTVVYNPANGKLYPVLDESNVWNLQTGISDENFEYFARCVRDNPLVRKLSTEHISRLVAQQNEIVHEYKARNAELCGGGLGLFSHPGKTLADRFFDDGGLENYKHLAPESSEYAGTLPIERTTRVERHLDETAISGQACAERYKSLVMKYVDGKLVIAPGVHEIKDGNVILPAGMVIEIQPGARIRIGPGLSVLSYSPVHILGEQDASVVVESLVADRPFGVFAVLGNSSTNSIVRHLDLSGGSEAFINGVFFSGALNFYSADVDMENCRIHHNHADDGLNVKNGRVRISNNRFFANYADQVDLDFCSGVISNNLFDAVYKANKGDGLDTSGAQVIIERNTFRGFNDKALSIGERTQCLIYDNDIEDNAKGVAAKDCSDAAIVGNRFTKNYRAITAYQKKEMFGVGRAYLFDNRFVNNTEIYDSDREFGLCVLDNQAKDGIALRLWAQHGAKDKVFQSIAKMRRKLALDKKQLEGLTIGDVATVIDEQGKSVCVQLPHGANTTQAIHWAENGEAKELYIRSLPQPEDIKSANDAMHPGQKITNGGYYDFRKYIFTGQLYVRNGDCLQSYRLYVTTGKVPIIDVNTIDEYGQIIRVPSDYRIACKVRVIAPQSKSIDTVPLPGSIETRGINWSKKMKYSLTLDRAVAVDAGMRKARRWVLESSFVDKSLMRNKICFDLLAQFPKSHSSVPMATPSRFAEVLLNGQYWGVYLLIPKVDDFFLGLEDHDPDKDHNAALYQCENWNGRFCSQNAEPRYLQEHYAQFGEPSPEDKTVDPILGWRSGFIQRWPRLDRAGEMYLPLENLVKFCAMAPQEEFESKIGEMIDLDNYIDLWILLQLSSNNDGTAKNQYIARYRGAGKKWFFVPFDYDGVLGRDWNMTKHGHRAWLRTPLFDRLWEMTSFRKSFLQRWRDLRERAVIAEQNMFGMIDRNMWLLGDAQKRNFERWPANLGRYPDHDNFEEEIGYMKNWITERIRWLDERLSACEKELADVASLN